MKMSQVIAVNNQKGGTAKTTTTKELGFIAAKEGYKCLLLDLDPQFSLSKSFGLTYKDVKGKSVYEVFMDELPVQDAIVKTNYENLSLLPASKELAMLDVDLAIKYNTNLLYNHLRRILADIRDDYDFIFIDTLPSLGMTALNALCVADWLLIPCVPEEACMTQLEDLMEVSRKIKIKLNQQLKYLGILPVMVDRRTSHHKSGLKLLHDHYSSLYKVHIFNEFIGVCTAFRDSVALQEPALAVYNEDQVLKYKSVFKELNKIVSK